jgi:hypothetical protein
MFSKSPLRLAIAALIAAPVCVQAEIEVSAVLKNETSFYTESGDVTGQARTTAGSDGHQQGDLMKFENSARIFINGDVGESSSWHAELRPVVDTQGTNADYKYHRNYTQNDYLRELYVDTGAGDWDLRIGKQQVVWGTADGIKLLDIINPTDFRELNQNAMEDSRIPVWMINAETNVGERGNVQLILSQAETNKVAGLWTQDDSGSNSRRSTVTSVTKAAGPPTMTTSPTGYAFTGNSQIQGQDRGHPFIMKGVDVITGGVNGFFNLGAAFGGVINTFGGFNPAGLNFIDPVGMDPVPMFGNPEVNTVDGFVNAPALPPACGAFGAGANGAVCLEAFTEATNMNVTNLIDVNPAATTVAESGWNVSKPNSAWEHFPNATFATFNSMLGMRTKYDRDYDDGDLPSDANLGGRFRSYLDNGLNYSVNYFYAYDSNPSLNMHWEDSNTGQKLVVDKYDTVAGTQVIQIRNPVTGQLYGASDVTFSSGAYAPGAPTPTNVIDGVNDGGAPTLVFVEDRERIHNLGGSFDYATQAADIPLVIRGEFLYQKDVNVPVVDRGALSNGDLVGALKSEEADFFKYVIGLDATVFTNLLVSGQFIQFRNLDFVDKKCSFTTQGRASASCSKYTGDPATMSVTNGLNKGWENKEFYSLFLSKPFGENQLGRVNNIIIYEEGGGYWNRLDAEYTLSDEIVLTGEWNHYWGDDDTTFGQFNNSSNIQVGVKFIIE